jgi:hypothetical protein
MGSIHILFMGYGAFPYSITDFVIAGFNFMCFAHVQIGLNLYREFKPEIFINIEMEKLNLIYTSNYCLKCLW